MKFWKLAFALAFLTGFVPGSGQAADTFGKLLTSHAWCSVRSGPDGRRIRIVFHGDGHYVLTGDHRGNEGHWKVKGRSLYMGEENGSLEPVASTIRKAGRGRYILFVDGEEFARCK